MVQRVREVLPTVSHSTVYRNLQELVREGLIRTLDGFQVERRDVQLHGVCAGCRQAVPRRDGLVFRISLYVLGRQWHSGGVNELLPNSRHP
jgi:Fe2+ or Zn2+ uptake regulation protein